MNDLQKKMKLKELLGLNGITSASRPRPIKMFRNPNDVRVLRNTERVDTVDTTNMTFRPWTDTFDFNAAVRKAMKEVK